jgi:hypothetical protein
MADLLKVTVERADGTRSTYPVLPRTRVDFERQFKTPLGFFSHEPYDERLYWMAWSAEKVSGAVVKPFESWLDGISAVEIEEEPGPLESPAPTPD